jgi:uncharacterized protein (TIGR00251 family)
MSAGEKHPRRLRALAPVSRAQPLPAASSCTLAIKAIPNAPRNEVVGWLGDVLKVRIHAPPVEGRANDALCEFLAASLSLHRRAVTVLRGDTSRQKVVRIDGLSLEEIQARFPG